MSLGEYFCSYCLPGQWREEVGLQGGTCETSIESPASPSTRLSIKKDGRINMYLCPENPSDSTPYDGDSSEQSSSTLPSVPASSAAMASTQTAPASPTEPSILANSASAPEVTTTVRTLNAASVAFSPSLDITLLQSSRTSSAEALSVDAAGVAEGSSGSASPAEPDVQILEALRSKDRLWVLKLGEMMETLINERKQYVVPTSPNLISPHHALVSSMMRTRVTSRISSLLNQITGRASI